jgi:tagatose 1,6-diphosphate aldolase
MDVGHPIALPPEPATMTYLLGARRGIAACASERGTFAVLALDHRQNLRKELRPDDPASVTYDEMVGFKRAVVRALAPVATGTLLDPEIGAAQCIADGSMPARAGLLVAIEATGYLGPSTARISRVLDGWSVEQAKRMGASAAKLLVYYHPDATNATDQERLVAEIAAACRDADLALFVEPISFSLDEGEKLTGEASSRPPAGSPRSAGTS